MECTWFCSQYRLTLQLKAPQVALPRSPSTNPISINPPVFKRTDSRQLQSEMYPVTVNSPRRLQPSSFPVEGGNGPAILAEIFKIFPVQIYPMSNH